MPRAVVCRELGPPAVTARERAMRALPILVDLGVYTPEEAEQRKRSGELPEDYAAVVLRPFVDSLGQEIARSLQFFFTSTPHNRVDHVLLAGGSASLPGLPEAVAAHTSFPSSVADPFEGMVLATGARGHRLRQDAPGYLTACGLAMRRFAW